MNPKCITFNGKDKFLYKKNKKKMIISTKIQENKRIIVIPIIIIMKIIYIYKIKKKKINHST